jgi:hypothetical protein
MNWRRGLLLAGMHLAVAIPLMVWIEADDVEHLKYFPRYSGSVEPIQIGNSQPGEFYLIDPCGMTSSGEFKPAAIVRSANLPSTIFVGWRAICPEDWTIAGMLHLSLRRPSLAVTRQLNLALGLLIPVQWFIVGGFPLIRPKRWWWEPSTFITLCTLTALVMVIIPGVREFSRIPMLLAVLAWLYWFGLLVWKTIRGGWKLATQ